jgi:FkbM family methyltransferase
MGLMECRSRFKSKIVSKREYIEEVYQLHLRLFEYIEFIKDTDINSIEIQADHLVLNLKEDIKLRYHLPDKGSAPFDILTFASYEKNEIAWIKNLLEPQMVFFDIGANIGWHSINIAKYDETLRVYAFEPIDSTFQALKENIVLNNLTHVNLCNLGFSNKNEHLTFYFDPNVSAFTSSRNNLKNSGAQKIISKVVRLDDFFIENNLERLDFIKCDVEGAELLVFQGALESIKRHKPIILAEMVRVWTINFNYHPNDIIEYLHNLGYCCFSIENNRLTKFPFMSEDEAATNFIFLHSEQHAEKIKKFSK